MKPRLVIAVALAGLWLAVVVGRLVDLQLFEHERYVDKAADQQRRIIELDPPRGTIYDAQGRELAVSVPVDSIYGVPKEIEDPATVAGALAPLLNQDPEELTRRLTGDGWWVSIARKVDPPTARLVRERVEELGLPGIGFAEEAKRYYPMRTLAAQLLGYVGTDNEGLTGLELVYDDRVAGRAVERPVLRDNRNSRLVSPGLSFAEPVPGEDLHLTLDATIQHILEEELAKAVEAQRAKGGMAVLLDPWSGAVLAMASYPTYDANRALEHDDLWRIRPVGDTYEPGSTFKVITAAAALENRRVDPTDLIDCELGAITLYGTRIRDHKPFGQLSFRQAMAKSSNVAAIKVGMTVGAEDLYETIRSFGFGESTGLDLHGESAGKVRPLESWHPITPAYASFGQGLTVTPIQLASAIAAVANGGLLYRPYIVARVGDETHRPEVVRRAISPATALQLERILEAVVEPGGTAQRARIPGYRIAGKTGTAQKAVGGGYSMSRLVPNFIGFAPARSPVIAGMVAIDEPRAGVTSGGLVAAPVFSAVMARVLPYMGVLPEPSGPDGWSTEPWGTDSWSTEPWNTEPWNTEPWSTEPWDPAAPGRRGLRLVALTDPPPGPGPEGGAVPELPPGLDDPSANERPRIETTALETAGVALAGDRPPPVTAPGGEGP